MAYGAHGVQSYYLPDLRVVDFWGLTDKVIARNPVQKPNHQRLMAHDRNPPPGYLEERGVNIRIHPPASSEAEALESTFYAVQVARDLWMPFSSPDQQWVMDAFSEHKLVVLEPENFIETGTERIQRVIRGGFDVYLDDGRLIYFRKNCRAEHTAATFFLHVVPADRGDLPAPRKRYGFNNLDFRFATYGLLSDGHCIATRALPDYDITAIRTGQWIPGEGRLWEGRFDFAEPAHDG